MRYEIIRARFIGADGSLGYRNGKTYWLVKQNKYNPWGVVAISRLNGKQYCPYATMAGFAANWRLA